MKYFIENKNLSAAIKVASQVKKPDSKIVLSLGLKELGDNVACQMRLTTDVEQVNYNFVAKKPEDFSGEAIVTSVDATKFLAIVESVLSFNEDVYIEVVGTILEVGILGKVKTSLPIESQIPEEIKPLSFFYIFNIGGSEIQSLLNKGCAFTEETFDTMGLHNAVLRLGRASDSIMGYSTDGHTVGCTTVKATFTKDAADEKQKARIEAMEKAVTEYCEKHSEQDKDNFNIIIPREAVQHLSRYAEGQKTVTCFVDSRFLHVNVGNVLMYTIKQAGSQIISIEQVKQMVSQNVTAKICADSANLRNSISFVNKNNAINGTADKTPVKLDINEGKILVATSGIEDKIESSIKTSAIEGHQLVALNGKKFEAALNALNKGNVVLQANDKSVAFFNGTLDAIDESTFIFVFQVNLAKVAEEEESEDVETSDDGTDESAE